MQEDEDVKCKHGRWWKTCQLCERLTMSDILTTEEIAEERGKKIKEQEELIVDLQSQLDEAKAFIVMMNEDKSLSFLSHKLDHCEKVKEQLIGFLEGFILPVQCSCHLIDGYICARCDAEKLIKSAEEGAE